ncbi:MAG: hypothetical protein ACXVED_12290 [Bacteroidia bacterium]
MSDKIKIKEIAEALKAKDLRTAIRWCKGKGISILKFGKEMYVNLIDFQLAIDRPLIESLKERYPECWREMYNAYRKSDFITITELELKKALPVKTKFVPPGPAGTAFLKDLYKLKK